MNINYRKISKKETYKHLKNMDKNGFTIVKNFIPQKTIKKYLELTKKIFKTQKSNSNTPKVWNTAKIIYNLQAKDINFVKIFNSTFFENVLKEKINDPHFRNLKKMNLIIF